MTDKIEDYRQPSPLRIVPSIAAGAAAEEPKSEIPVEEEK